MNLGNQANAWQNDEATGVGGTSEAFDSGGCPNITAFGHVSAACTITVQISQDGNTWYDTQLTQVLAGAGDFAISGDIGARYVRLKSSANVNATATIAAKK